MSSTSTRVADIGTYTIEIRSRPLCCVVLIVNFEQENESSADEELLQTSSLPAYKRVSTLMRLPSRPTGTMLTQIVEVNPLELAAALERDAQPAETTPQPTRGGGLVRRNSTASRMGTIREGWQYWVTLNANDLTWTALVIGGVLFTSWLMRG